jgi:hypothetical protein
MCLAVAQQLLARQRAVFPAIPGSDLAGRAPAPADDVSDFPFR